MTRGYFGPGDTNPSTGPTSENNELTGDDREDLEISMLAMLLPGSLVLVNTLILHQLLAEPEWAETQDSSIGQAPRGCRGA